MSDLLAYVLIGALSLLVAPASAPPDLRTVAEQSNYVRTGRYDEVERAVRGVRDGASPTQVRCVEFGTHAGRPADAGAGRVRGRRADRGGGHARKGRPVRAGPGRHPRRRDRRQGRRLPGAARAARRQRRAGRRSDASRAGVRAGVQRRRPRALRRAGTAPTSAAPRRWAGAPPRRTSTSTATT